jgi:hypothetical protein
MYDTTYRRVRSKLLSFQCAVLDNDKGMMQKYFDRDPSLKSSLPTSRLKSIARWQMSFQYQD